MTISIPFYTSRLQALRAGFANARAEADRLAVASVHVPIKLLTDKERTRHSKVESLLAKGENPYTPDLLKESGKNLHGSNATDRVINYDALDRETEEQFKAKLDHWSERPTPHNNTIEGLDLRSEAEIKRDPFKLYCSFCGNEIKESFRATVGSGPSRKILKREVVKDEKGLNTIEDKMIHVTDKLTACPDCCLELQATETLVRNSRRQIIATELVNHVKFPDFD